MSKPSEREAHVHLSRLIAQVDAFFDRVHQRHGDQMDCARGCTDCCAPGLSVTSIEADVIEQHLATLDAEARAVLAAQAQTPGERCSALLADGSCGIYEARPLVCRSHGVPIVEAHDDQGLPVINVCPRNFTANGALEATDKDCRLHSSGLAMRLLAIDSAFADARDSERGQRVELDAILAG